MTGGLDPLPLASGSPTASGAQGWPAWWDKPTCAKTKTEALKLVAHCKDREIEMQKALRMIVLMRGHHAGRRMARRYLKSFSARLAALAKSFERKETPIKDASFETLSDLIMDATKLSPWKPIGERSIAVKIEKPKSGFRWIHRHGLILYAQELLAIGAARPLANLLSTQFLSKGGIPKFESWLREKLPSAKLVITVDIPGCFDNIKRSSVADNLNLPSEVVKQVLFQPMDKARYLSLGPQGLVPDIGPIDKAGAAARSIAQGSALSQLASEIVIGIILREIAEIGSGIHVASHGDNLAFLLEDASLRGSVISTLASSIQKHFGGGAAQALACRIDYKTPKEGFWFCKRKYTFVHGKLGKSLPENYVADFGFHTIVAIQDARGAKDTEKLDSIERSIKGWMGQNLHIKGVVDEAAKLLGLLYTVR